MNRLGALALAAAMLAGVGASPAASADDCEKAVAYGYCGEHWRLGRLPVRFRYDPTGAPGGIGLTSSAVEGAIRGAVGQWESYWRVGPGSASGCEGTGPWRGLCYAGLASGRGFGRDNVNTITWGSLPPPGCASGHLGAVAVACLWFEGASGAAALRIAEADIVLANANFCGDPASPPRCWKVVPSEPDDLAYGELEGLVPTFTVFCSTFHPPCERWQDVQSVLTHEIGHALGLADIGTTDPDEVFPSSLWDAPRYTQTMYRWYYRRSTNKRSLDFGDVLGLSRVQLRTAQDP